MSLDLSKLVNLRRNGSGWVAQCPACAAVGNDTKGKNHLGILSDGRFNCIVDNSSDHRSFIFSLVGIGENGQLSSFQPVEPPVEIERTWPVSLLDRLIKDYSYWVKRGVSEEVLVPLRGGVAVDGQMRARFVFPIFNGRDEIIGFTGRSLGNVEPRWRHLGKVSKWVWGDLDEIESTGQAILVEGAGCRLALATHGVPQALPLWGLNISDAVIGALISANPRDIIIATNNEESGRGQIAAIKIKRVLDKFFDPGVVRIELPLAKDFLDMSPQQMAEWKEDVLSNKPERAFSLDT